MNKKLKLLPIFMLPFFLTACKFDYSTGGFDILATFNRFWTSLVFGAVRFFNGAVATIRILFIKMSNNTFETVTEFLNALQDGQVTTIINVITLLACVAIAVRFASSVLKNNMMENNDSFAPDTMTMVKKIGVALVLTFIVPYLCVTAFMSTTFLGAKVSGMISAGNQQDSQLVDNKWEIYEKMQKEGVNYLTYCGPQAKDAGLLGFSIGSSLKSEPGNWEIINDVESTPDGGFSAWCDGNPESVNVYESLFAKGKPYHETMVFTPSFNSFISIISAILTAIIFVVAWLGSLYALATRVCELLLLIVTSWYYISGSLTDSNGESIGALFKKLSIICLTQFFFMFEMGIFVSLTNPDGNLAFVVLQLAFVMIMLKTPSAIAELVQDSGTATNAAALGKFGMRRFFGK